MWMRDNERKVNRVCGEIGCKQEIHARGVCFKHYEEKRRAPGVGVLTETQFVLLKDMRSSGWSPEDVAVELRKHARVAWYAWEFDTYKDYLRGIYQMRKLWSARGYRPWSVDNKREKPVSKDILRM